MPKRSNETNESSSKRSKLFAPAPPRKQAAPKDTARKVRTSVLRKTAKGNLGSSSVHSTAPNLSRLPPPDTHTHFLPSYSLPLDPEFSQLCDPTDAANSVGDDDGVEGPSQLAVSHDPLSQSNKLTHILLSKSHTQEWLVSQRQLWLDELLRLDAPGPSWQANHMCPCGVREARFRCHECLGFEMFCSQCLVKNHCRLPLHRIEQWNGIHFDVCTLRDCGVIVQLGHPPGEACLHAVAAYNNFTVVHTNGSHNVKLFFCGCSTVEHHVQLLRFHWLPASWQRPRTAVTVDYLKMFQMLSNTAKTTLWDYYRTIQFLGDNAGLRTVKYQRQAVLFAVRAYRHLKILKWGGSGHLAKGVESTPRGSLAVLCPPCPHPGINLPPGWRISPDKWIYTLFIAVDACFRLKLKDRGVKDPEFGAGWSYFVHGGDYHRLFESATHAQDIPPCGNQHNAVQQALTRGNSKTVATGVVAAICSRHAMMLPNGVGDLQKGERFANVDFVLASALALVAEDIETLNISYDIMCTYIINFKSRFAILISLLCLPWLCVLRGFIPKFHLPGHGETCQDDFSFNVNSGVGQSHGETIEQIWAYLGISGTSTSEMGPGNRHLVLEDMMGAQNHRKVVNLGNHFAHHLPDAVKMRNAYRDISDRFSATFPEQVVATWKAMVEAWQQDHSNPDPFHEPESSNNLETLREELANEDAELRARFAEFVRLGLVLEGSQYYCRRSLKRRIESAAQRTSTQRTSIQQQRASLKYTIHSYLKAQAVYMPACGSLRNSSDIDAGLSTEPEVFDPLSSTLPEEFPLLLPSGLDAGMRRNSSLHTVVNIETRMRLAQAQDSLIQLRHLRRVYQGLSTRLRKKVWGVGQKTNTRSRTILQGFLEKIHACRDDYRAAYGALKQLDADGSWTSYLLPLRDEDISGPGKDEEEEVEYRTKQKEYIKSWIWLTTVPGKRVVSAEEISDTELNEQVRAQWAKTDARAARWEEEVILLVEEMRRTLVWLEWRAGWWEARSKERTNVAVDLQRGLIAYAMKQQSIQRQRLALFASRWIPLLRAHQLGSDWRGQYEKYAQKPDKTEVAAPAAAASVPCPVDADANASHLGKAHAPHPADAPRPIDADANTFHLGAALVTILMEVCQPLAQKHGAQEPAASFRYKPQQNVHCLCGQEVMRRCITCTINYSGSRNVRVHIVQHYQALA
ncbi:hypothetical protein PUNSTDRAFT_75000 [Punctularia strigosozonata HHB-11173 SS5]|uniref:CxC2-like cysteine cluster KDZ transposase-associated domain-containing protein n=1 Tax=Punctularia strigosozonata (strain HHB-11173) TaxID=741275 RepID=R7S5G5_PUNST|nr:uncharacterized protein PUNSTDRAFT_75000 [Punctularia strigosozonata HHB-11173 SS5]EIN05219.1 hypothetical protein PUNSTDRAFT_75000 [Punctularia strigosozonata HHB-11173 SS5]